MTSRSLNARTTRFVARGPESSGAVALTFHTNGDVALAHQLLDLVDERNAQVTAFIVGNWLDQHPDWAKRLVDNGHELANHTYSHRTFARLPLPEMTDEIGRCRDALVRTSGSGGHFFRPSGTANGTDSPLDTVMAAAGAAGYETVLGYDVDPADYQDPGPAIVARRTIAQLHPGAVVSLHFGHLGTIRALPKILDALDQRGLRAATASDLLGS
jgi:peptidoglycan/xylan/chitin deacetylase (PgdA/CDA1 family)